MTQVASRCIISLTDNTSSTSNAPLPSKFAGLQQAAAAGLRIPLGVLLPEQEADHALDSFLLQARSGQRFIVRSANPGEDGDEHSLAGHFWSSGAVSAQQLPATVQQAMAENRRILQALGQTAVPRLLVQAFIEHQIGGVLFAPWSFFPDYACLNYSTESVQQVVAGNAQTAIISLEDAHASPLPLSAELGFLLPLLRTACRQLRAGFAFPLDCEWVYSLQEQALIILQVRPQTHAVGAVLALPDHVEQVFRDQLPPGDWQFTALSESFGSLSPLSFSLLQQLYTDAIPTFRTLGCKALAADFMVQAPDGLVLVEPLRERQFFALSTLGGFWRSFRQPALRRRVLAHLTDTGSCQQMPFSYTRLALLFQHWMIANLYAAGEGRASLVPVHAYELSWLARPDVAVKSAAGSFAGSAIDLTAANAALATWPELNQWARRLFFQELGQLKQQLQEQPLRAFCHWNEYSQPDDTRASARQHARAAEAIYAYATFGSVQRLQQSGSADLVDSVGMASVDMKSLAAVRAVQGKVCVIHQPATYHAVLPPDCILIAPYFDNRWVGMIKTLRGIIVGQGSHLSHSAIVAREYAVPYCVVNPAAWQTLQTGMTVHLDPLQRTLRVAGAADMAAANRLDG